RRRRILYCHENAQSEILRYAQDDSEGPRMTAGKCFSAACEAPPFQNRGEKSGLRLPPSGGAEKMAQAWGEFGTRHTPRGELVRWSLRRAGDPPAWPVGYSAPPFHSGRCTWRWH